MNHHTLLFDVALVFAGVLIGGFAALAYTCNQCKVLQRKIEQAKIIKEATEKAAK